MVGAWKTEYGQATVQSIMKRIWLKDFRAEIETYISYKGLTAEPLGVFCCKKELVEKYRIE